MEDSPSIEDARHIDHEALRRELQEEYEGRNPAARTVTLNGQRYRLFTIHEYLASPNQPTTRWEVFELIALIDQRKAYESRWGRFWRGVIRFLNRLGGSFTVPPPPTYIKIPVGKIKRSSR